MSRSALRAPPAALVLAIAAALPATAQVPAEVRPVASPATPRLLDVPYVAQSEDLCGGAALAMVRRYWGDRKAVAEDFASLVDPAEGGIRTGRLTEAAGLGGWVALPFAGDAARGSVAAQLRRGRPVIVLLLDRPGVYHYVVITARTASVVVFHDPARAPFQTLTVEEFDRRWSSTNHWMLLVVPSSTAEVGPERRPVLPSTRPIAVGSSENARGPCTDLIGNAIERAAEGRLEEAAGTLDEATRACPGEARAWRELAGVRFLQRRWPDAEASATRSLAIDDTDHESWRLLGATRFIQGDLNGALRALNRAGDPMTNQVVVDGASLTPHPVVIDSTGLRPRQLLEAGAFARAARRLADLPVAEQTALRYTPTTDDDMTVQAALVERDRVPVGWVNWTVTGGRALGSQTLTAEFAGPARSGELWSAAWRWNRFRPMVRFGLATPAPGRVPGVVRVDGGWERATYATVGRGGPVEQTRRRVGVGVTDWLTGTLRWQLGTALDQFDEDRYLNLSGGVDRRWLDDRASLAVAFDGWIGSRGSATRFGRGIVAVGVRSSARVVSRVSARAGVALASQRAPLIVWPNAGIGSDRLATLRAHALHTNGIVTGPGLGRLLAFASAEHAQPVLQTVAGRAWWASFVDVVAVDRRGGAGSPSPTHVDIGTGLRVQLPRLDGVVNLDVAYGVRDGQVRVSAAVRRAWPGS